MILEGAEYWTATAQRGVLDLVLAVAVEAQAVPGPTGVEQFPKADSLPECSGKAPHQHSDWPHHSNRSHRLHSALETNYGHNTLELLSQDWPALADEYRQYNWRPRLGVESFHTLIAFPEHLSQLPR